MRCPWAAGINVVATLNGVIGPSVLRAPAEQTKVATVLGTFFHFSFLVVVTTVIQNHRRGCRIVSNFCMGP